MTNNEILIFSDNARANTPIREENIKLLYSEGFKDCSAYSTSGNLEFARFRKKAALRFGVCCNSGGKFPSYTTLVKTFEKDSDRLSAFNALSKKLNAAAHVLRNDKKSV